MSTGAFPGVKTAERKANHPIFSWCRGCEYVDPCIHIYLTPVVNFGEVRRAQLAKSILVTSMLELPGILSDLSRSVQMLKKEWGAESKGKLPYLFYP